MGDTRQAIRARLYVLIYIPGLKFKMEAKYFLTMLCLFGIDKVICYLVEILITPRASQAYGVVVIPHIMTH